MPNKMLIDASHPEETRVIVLRGNRVEEFDFESADRKQLRGNIYLAKVTRVEPSLQAAFVEYGGNRHGFLAFSEIHPDYYQIPVADRQALLEEEARAERDAEDDDNRQQGGGRRRGRRRHSDAAKRRREESVSGAAQADTDSTDGEGADGQAPEAEDIEVPAEGTEMPAAAGVGHGAQSDEGGPQVRAVEPVGDASSSHDARSSELPQPVATIETPTEPIADHSGLETAPVPTGDVGAPVVDDAATRPHVVAEEAASEVIVEAAPSAGAEASAPTPDADSQPVEERAAAEGDDHPVVVARTRADEEDGSEVDDDETEGDDASEEDDEDDDEDEDGDGEAETQIEQIGGDAMEEVPSRPTRPRRHYKIQEVIKRRQVLLVQVVKEERGNKGAALTTYLSLAGRYSVLMPNTARGGGISRKITDTNDRKRLKSIAEELEVPEGMGIILRTAGASRTKVEVKRDFEYLLRMWETVREVTLGSTAPTLVYEEGSLIKRAIRDLYNKDVEEILVAGDDGHKEAKDFMRLLMPSHAKNVQPYKEAQPIFAFAGAEAQLDGMYFNQVTLRSGGYIVINQTEALVAIDVNSGRSTREHNIEDTALRTNLEAADEVARQLRLRDLAGLIVVDFIDMEEGRNNRAVERRMKDALKNDRARIQIGRISHFGLLEMSRQRIRTGVLEGSTVPCSHCMGSGMVRSTSSIALHVLRGLEDALIKNPNYDVTVRTRTEVALYILNQKRSHLRELEDRFGVTITLAADSSLSGVSYYAIERGELATKRVEVRPARDLVRVDSVRPIYDDETVEDEDTEEEDGDAEGQEDGNDAVAGRDADGGDDGEEEREDGRGRPRRRRRRRGGRERNGHAAPAPDAPQPSDDGLAVVMEISGDRQSPRRDRSTEESDEGESQGPEPESEYGVDGEPIVRGRPSSRRRRRSRRSVDNRRPNQRDDAGESPAYGVTDDHEGSGDDPARADEAGILATETVPAPVPAMADQAQTEVGHGDDAVAAARSPHDGSMAIPADEPAATTPARDGDGTLVAVPAAAAPDSAAAPEPAHASMEPRGTANADSEIPEIVPADDEPPRPKRSGWWQRAKATFGA